MIFSGVGGGYNPSNHKSDSKICFDLAYLISLKNVGETKAFLFDSRFNWDVFSSPQIEYEFSQGEGRGEVEERELPHG